MSLSVLVLLGLIADSVDLSLLRLGEGVKVALGEQVVAVVLVERGQGSLSDDLLHHVLAGGVEICPHVFGERLLAVAEAVVVVELKDLLRVADDLVMLRERFAGKLLSIAVLVDKYLCHGNVIGFLHYLRSISHVHDVGHGLVNYVQYAEQKQEGYSHGAAAAHRAVALLLELRKLLLLLFLIVLVFLLDLSYLRCENC